jgi:type IV pilus assembly protein PilY1
MNFSNVLAVKKDFAMSTQSIRKIFPVMFCCMTLYAMLSPAMAAITPAQKPLYLGASAAKPNIMLMVDNSGSMSSDVITANTAVSPNDMPSGFSYSCSWSYVMSGGSTTSPAPTITNMTVNSSGVVKFCTNSSCSSTLTFGNKSTKKILKKCFDNTKYYDVRYYNNGPSLGNFLGKNLNWYFSTGTFTPGSLSATTTTTQTRMAIAKDAATDLVDALIPDSGFPPTVRLGLSTFKSPSGGDLLAAVEDLDATKALAVKGKVSALSPSGWTPLAETLADIGRYFTSGYTGNLMLHPGATSSTGTIDNIFNNHSIENSTAPDGSSATLPASGPIQASCQKSATVFITDGLPTQDRAISTALQDYDGDCSGANAVNCLPSPHYDMKKAFYSSGYDPGSDSSQRSEYLDDVAMALYDMDLRPDLEKTKPGQKNNLFTYTIGFADPSLDPNIPGNNPLLKNTAAQGGGLFYYSADSRTLALALEDVIEDIVAEPYSSASVATNSSQLNNDTAIFQGKYLSGAWTGSLVAYPLAQSEDANGNGTLDPGEDANGNGKLDGGGLGAQAWDAATKIPSFASRNIFTYIPYTSGVSGAGALFQCASLTANQKTSLGIADCASSTDQGVWRLNYLRGDWSHEQLNPFRRDADTIRSTAASDRVFRNRTLLDENTRRAVSPDPWVLGDIVNSNPVYVGTEDYSYDKLPGAEGTSYTSFRAGSSYLARRVMIYVGANDGMLHGFDASTSGDDAGMEVLAYVPNGMFTGLSGLSDPAYTHRYFVDGSARVADAYFGSAWHTVLVGATGAGGKGIFALDITDPDNFTASKVLWEIASGEEVPDGNAANKTEFANNLGFTLPQASIVRMANGKFAAVIGNGYGSTNNKAVLYIIDIANGNLIRAIDTLAGDSTTPNGLSTPMAADINNDRIVDYIYAGDLLGNLWKFDVTDASASNWDVAFSGSPLFVAKDASGNRQSITSKPQVGMGPDSGGYLVYFGTGKYFEAIDNDVTSPQTQTFYGILDNNATVAQRGDLQEQEIINQEARYDYYLRETTDTVVDYPTQKGWYMDLLEPGASASIGERVVSNPMLRGDRIIFSTMRPIPPNNADPCSANSDGVSWLMEMNAKNGSRLPATTPPWDISGDGKIDSSDLLADGNSPSGKRSKNGIHGSATVVSAGLIEYKYTSGSNEGQVEVTTETGGGGGAPGGRQSWRQLQ